MQCKPVPQILDRKPSMLFKEENVYGVLVVLNELVGYQPSTISPLRFSYQEIFL